MGHIIVQNEEVPLCTDDSDDEQIGGTVRLAEALQAHIWPAMTMKGHRKSDVLEPLASRDTSSDVQKPPCFKRHLVRRAGTTCFK